MRGGYDFVTSALIFYSQSKTKNDFNIDKTHKVWHYICKRDFVKGF